MHSICSALQQSNGSTTAIDSPRTSQQGEAPKWTKTKPVEPCVHGGYQASFEACFTDLRMRPRETESFNSTVGKTVESVTA